MVHNRDGTVDKVTVVRASGYLPFDAAAIDAAYNAGPYPDPPRAIRSANGKIYVHWQFHRDERQCATSGVDYFILDNAPAGADRPVVSEPPPEAPRAVTAPAAGAPAAGAPANGAPGAAPATPATNAQAGTPHNDGGLRRLRRFDDRRHSAKMQRLDEEVAMAEEQGEASSPAHAGATPPSPAAASAASRASDPEARAVAERWFTALAAGDAAALSSMAVLPFKTSAKEVTKKGALAAMLTDLVGEEKTSKPRLVEVFTTAGLRGAIGKLPANVDDGSGNLLYALATNGRRDAMILILGKRGNTWRPVGLVRR
jgi:TonB family protein